MGYENLIFNFVEVVAPSMIVFLMLSVILDYLRTMIFNNK